MQSKFLYAPLTILFLTLIYGCGSSSPTPIKSNPTVVQVLTSAPIVIPAPQLGDTRISEIDRMQLIYIPAGNFLMGNDNGATYEKPEHSVYLDGYWIDKTEVTNAMFVKFITEMGNTKAYPELNDSFQLINYYSESHIHKIGDGWQIDEGYENHPVTLVNWYGADSYCSWAGRRLPSEAEWEKSARGIDGRVYPWGNTFDCHNGNFDDETQIDAYTVPGGPSCDGYQKTAPVGNFSTGASPYGVLDMSGNVFEWVNDRFDEFSYSKRPAIIPTALTELELLQMPGSDFCPHPDAFCDEFMEPDENHVIRGGSWYSDNLGATTFSRDWEHSSEFYTQVGFRCATSP